MLAISISTAAAEALEVSLETFVDIQATRYAKMVCAMVILYDHVITLGDEVNLIWREKWSTVKIIFLINRYYSLVSIVLDSSVMFANGIDYALLFDKSCSRYYYWATYTCLILAILSQVILQLRIHAMYSGKRSISAFMTLCFIASSITSAWILWTNLRGIQFIKVPVPPHTTFCIPTQISKFYSVWIPLLAFEVLLCMLAFFKGVRRIQLRDPLFPRRRTLLAVLVRDSLIYFIVIAIVYLVALLFWIFARPGLLQGPSGFPAAFSSILSNRAILNLRRVAKEDIVILDSHVFSIILRDQQNESPEKRDGETTDR